MELAELISKSAEMEELFVRRGQVLPADAPESQLVRRVGAAVVRDMKIDPYVHFRIAVVNSAVPNAFALPDGQIYVHQGLLAILENESQLAAVLAHESIHVEGHHSIVNSRQARSKAGGMIALSVILGPVGDLINIAFIAAIIGYGRDLEKEADVRGLHRTLAAGYDPREMPRVFELLGQDHEGDRPDVSVVWSNHPLAVQRSAYTTELLAGMQDRIAEAEAARAFEADERAFLDQTTTAVKQSVHDFIAMDRPRTALSLARRLVEHAPEDAGSHAALGASYVGLDARTPEPRESELTRASKRASRRERGQRTPYEREQRRLAHADASVLDQNRSLARAAFDEALRLDAANLDALDGLAKLERAEGRFVEAGRLHVAWLRAAPQDDPDRPLVLRRLAEITERVAAAPAGAKP